MRVFRLLMLVFNQCLVVALAEAQLLAYSLFISEAYAAPPQADLDAIIREQNRNQQQQELRRQEQERKAREGAGKQTIIPRETPQQPQLPEDFACVDADRIEVTGSTALSEDEIQALISPYMKRCLTLADINELMKDITKVYVDRGLVAVRVYLPPQELNTGLLIIQVVEGRVEAVEPSPPDSVKFLELAMAFPGVIGRPLDLRDFE